MNTFNQLLESIVPQIETEIDTQTNIWKTEVAKHFPLVSSLVDEFIKSTEGGKRLRGAFILLGYLLFRKDIPSDLLKIAASYEICQTSLLIHDDIIDKSMLRRNIPTIQKRLGNTHYALSQSICLGDLGFFLSSKILSYLRFPDAVKNNVFHLFFQTIHDTILGEMSDVLVDTRHKNISESDILHIISTKTSLYSVVTPLQLGAIIALRSESDRTLLGKLGGLLGAIYQIQDDILGVFSDEDTIGKSVISDCREGKITLLYHVAYKNADTSQRSFLDTWYGNDMLGPTEMDTIKKIFKETGSLSYAHQFVNTNVASARKFIATKKIFQRNEKLLNDCVDMLVEREK